MFKIILAAIITLFIFTVGIQIGMIIGTFAIIYAAIYAIFKRSKK